MLSQIQVWPESVIFLRILHLIKILLPAGGSGFGLMAIVSGMSLWLYFKNTRSRPFEQNCYLSDTAAFSRCMATINGTTGRVIPFGTKDNGDLVETSFLVAGMITVPRIL
jgi:hypothetical protein